MQITLNETNHAFPVRLLMKNLALSCDLSETLMTPADYLELFEMKIYDDSLWAMVDDVQEGRGIRHPICVRICDDGRWMLGNGHHRFTVALMLGMDTLDVYFSTDNDMEFSHTDPDIMEDRVTHFSAGEVIDWGDAVLDAFYDYSEERA